MTNPGAGTLAVNLIDQLPAQLSYVSMDPSSDFVLDPNPPANPQSLTFATLNIAPGETKYAKFVARASAECIGAVENVATVTGVYSSACLPAPGTATVGPVEARATVVCQSKPCISEVKCEVPATVCVGQNYTVAGSAKNCGDRPADLTVTLKDGAGAVIKTQKFVGVAPGATVTLTSDPIACAAPGVNNYSVEGTAENDCGTSDLGTSQCSVTCKSLPCVSDVACQVPAEICVGQSYTVKGSAKNCGDRVADVTVTIKTGAGAVVKTQKFVGVAAGAVVTLESDPITCAAPGVNNYVIEGKAENDCGASDVLTSNCSVTCKSLPCVSDVACQVPAEFWSARATR